MTLVIAHRGYSGKYPENTPLAFKKAVEAGADGIELDVHMTKDSELVICHDETIDRTSNGSGFIKDLTLAELKEFVFYGEAGASALFNAAELRIWTLAEFLEWFKPFGLLVNIELKTDKIAYQGIEELAGKLLNYYDMAEQTIISSFNLETIINMQAIYPDFKYGYLSQKLIIQPVKLLKKHGLKFYHPHHKLANKLLIKHLASNDIKVNLWTVNNDEDISRSYRLGVNSIITNEVTKALNLKKSRNNNEDLV